MTVMFVIWRSLRKEAEVPTAANHHLFPVMMSDMLQDSLRAADMRETLQEAPSDAAKAQGSVTPMLRLMPEPMTRSTRAHPLAAESAEEIDEASNST